MNLIESFAKSLSGFNVVVYWFVLKLGKFAFHSGLSFLVEFAKKFGLFPWDLYFQFKGKQPSSKVDFFNFWAGDFVLIEPSNRQYLCSPTGPFPPTDPRALGHPQHYCPKTQSAYHISFPALFCDHQLPKFPTSLYSHPSPKLMIFQYKKSWAQGSPNRYLLSCSEIFHWRLLIVSILKVVIVDLMENYHDRCRRCLRC